MILMQDYSRVRQASRRVATNYATTKQFAKDLIYYFNQNQILARRVEQDIRRYLNNLKPFEDKD